VCICEPLALSVGDKGSVFTITCYTCTVYEGFDEWKVNVHQVKKKGWELTMVPNSLNARLEMSMQKDAASSRYPKTF